MVDLVGMEVAISLKTSLNILNYFVVIEPNPP